jgi:integrase
MRGHIIKRGKDSYTIVLNLGTEPATGKRKQQWVSMKGNKKDAEKRLSELQHQLDTGSFMKPGKTTVNEYLQLWLKDYVYPNLSPRTAEGYESIVRVHLVPALGRITLTHLKPEHIQTYYSDKLKSKCLNRRCLTSSRTVRRHHMVLHCALEVATKWGLISRNPADAVDPPPERHIEMLTMNENDIGVFLEAINNPLYYPLFYTALFTGMRRSELLALRWSDIDLLLCQLSVTRSLHQLHDRSFVFKQPKTEKGRRLIALTPSTALVLKEHKEKQIVQRMVLGTTLKENDLIFCQPDGSPVLPDTVSNVWRKLVTRIGLKGIRLHDARHTHASLMLKQGIHPKVVQERLGHASIQITLDTYSHVAPGLQQAAANRFDDVVLNKPKILQKEFSR